METTMTDEDRELLKNTSWHGPAWDELTEEERDSIRGFVKMTKGIDAAAAGGERSKDGADALPW